jgi:hypothetical protein
METLFGYLAPRFRHPENLATEGLYFVLNRCSEARRLFTQVLRQSGVSFASDLTFETQAAEQGAIPDLAAKDAAGSEVAIVEAKFWAPLTDRQPNGYLDRLSASAGLLLFIAPARRFEPLWPELLRRCKSVGRQVTREARHGAEWRVAGLSDGRVLALTSWRAVLEALHTGLQVAGELPAAADVLQVRGLADRMDAEAFLPLTSEELTSTLGTRILQFCGLVDDAVKRLERDGLADSTGTKASAGAGWWLRSFRLHHTGASLFFDARSWSQHGQPIWLRIQGSNWQPSAAVDDALRPLAQETPPRLVTGHFDQKYGAHVPICLPTAVERDEVLEAMMRQISGVALLLRNVPPSGRGTTPTVP